MFLKAIIFSLLTLSACGGGKGKSSKAARGASATECSDLKVATDCTAADKIPGKVCQWMANSCIESSAALTAFMSADQEFKVTIKNESNSEANMGHTHRESPNFAIICRLNGNYRGLKDSISKFTLKFLKDSDKVELILDCDGASTGQQKYLLAYNARVVDGKNLVITLDLNGKEAIGQWNTTRTGNLLEFFSKADWIYLKDNNEIIGVIQLAKNGYRTEPTIPLTNEAEFTGARTYITDSSSNNPGYNVGPNTGGMVFTMPKI